MSVEIKVLTINGLTLKTKDTYVDDDIAITLDLPRYDGSFMNATIDKLPSGYTQLMYIESTGEQYIDTKFNMTTASEIELTMQITEYNTKAKMGFLGSYETNVLYQLYASDTGNEYLYASFGGKNFVALNKFDLNVLYNISMKANTVTINSVTQNFTSDGLNSATKPLYLFWRNETGEKAKMKLYACNIYNNNVAVRKFVPCLRNEDNIIGLYDLVERRFHENEGTGTFIGG